MPETDVRSLLAEGNHTYNFLSCQWGRHIWLGVIFTLFQLAAHQRRWVESFWMCGPEANVTYTVSKNPTEYEDFVVYEK